MSQGTTIKETTVENVIRLKETYYRMKNNQFISTKKITTITNTIKIIEVENYNELSMLLEAQNNKAIETALFEKNMLRVINN